MNLYLKLCGVLVLCAISGALGAWLFPVGSSIAVDADLKYTDLIAIILTALSVIITILAIFLGVAGVIGWRSISSGAKNSVEEFLKTESKDGGVLDRIVRAEAREAMFQGIDSMREQEEQDYNGERSDDNE